MKILGKEVDIERIVKDAVAAEKVKQHIGEAYVAQPKFYNQVTEFLSQKTKDAHTAIYKTSIDALNKISAKLDTARVDQNLLHSEYASLKADEAKLLNSVYLHELYFANCFDPHSEIFLDTKCYLKLEKNWGSFDTWQDDFISCALSVQNGWAVCGFNFFLKKYVNFIINDDSNDVTFGVFPILVLDCHEHAYWRDYMFDKKSYVVSQLQQINWEIVEERVNKAEAIAGVVR